MSTIQFFGAVGTVTGSCFMLTPQTGKGILIDMGMFQGSPEISALNHQPIQFKSLPSAVFITHAHLDHCGRLPLLARLGFTGPIYMTGATRMLTELTLLDAAKIAQEKNNRVPLFSEEDVIDVLKQVKTVEYNQSLTFDPFTVIFHDAGHILGSAIIEIYDKQTNKTIVFSGDLGNSPEALVQPTARILKADTVVMEATYGDRVHKSEDPTLELINEIKEVEKSKGVLLIPAFSVERSQELLHAIDHLKKNGSIQAETAVFLDSPMAIKATEIYRGFRNLYSAELTEHVQNDDPFDFPGLTMCDTIGKSKQIRTSENPKIIIAGSGMLTGGRMMFHLIDFLGLPTTRLLIVGYQAERTLGRIILEGAQTVRVNDKEVHIRAAVSKLSGLSAHADQPKLLRWLEAIKGVKKVFLIHAEDQSRNVMAEKIRNEVLIDRVELPYLNEVKEIS